MPPRSSTAVNTALPISQVGETICGKCRRMYCSVIVSCLDNAPTLAATLECALACDDVRDVIVVDRGSKDATLDLLGGLGSAEPRLKVLRLRGANPAHARNAGICAAQGKILAFVDSGEIWGPNYLEAQLSRFAARPGLGVSVGSCGDIARSRQAILRTTAVSPIDCLMGGAAMRCSAIVARRSVFDEAGLFNLALNWSDCREWLFRATTSGWRVRANPQACVQNSYPCPGGAPASDRAIEADFEAFLSEARRTAPAIVDEHTCTARAFFHLDLANQALQLGRHRAIARRHLRAAFAAWPLLLCAAPADVMRTAAGCLALPGRLVSVLARPLPQ